MEKLFTYFFTSLCAYVVRDHQHQRIQILLFPLRSTSEMRAAICRSPDSMPRLPASHSHPQSAVRHGLHPGAAGIRENVGHVSAEIKKRSQVPSSKFESPKNFQSSMAM